MPSLILWDIDYTLLDPNYRTRIQLQYLWAEIVQPVLEEARAFLPQIVPAPSLMEARPSLLTAFAEEETCCAGLSAIILEIALGGTISKWLPVHDEIFYAITGMNHAHQPLIWEMIQEVDTTAAEQFYPGIPELLRRLPVTQLLVTHRETLAMDHPLREIFPPTHVFTREQGDKATELGRAMLLDAIAAHHPLIAEETVMIGDTPKDASLAADLGCDFLLAAYGHRQYQRQQQDYATPLARLKQYQVIETIEKMTEHPSFVIEP